MNDFVLYINSKFYVRNKQENDYIIGITAKKDYRLHRKVEKLKWLGNGLIIALLRSSVISSGSKTIVMMTGQL